MYPNARVLTTGAPNEILAELVQAIESRKIQASPPRQTMRQSAGLRSAGAQGPGIDV
jgi:hypothetical protein